MTDAAPSIPRPVADRLHEYVIADVFTATPLEGNALAVFLDGSGLDAERMQRTARELHLSETVFVLPPEAGGDARIRIFTPTRELPFAGHPVPVVAPFPEPRALLHARAVGSAECVERVEVGGAAVIVARGAYRLRSSARSGEGPGLRMRCGGAESDSGAGAPDELAAVPQRGHGPARPAGDPRDRGRTLRCGRRAARSE